MSNKENNNIKNLTDKIGIKNPGKVYYNATPELLIEETILRGQGFLSDKGALSIQTGEYTGSMQANFNNWKKKCWHIWMARTFSSEIITSVQMRITD